MVVAIVVEVSALRRCSGSFGGLSGGCLALGSSVRILVGILEAGPSTGPSFDCHVSNLNLRAYIVGIGGVTDGYFGKHKIGDNFHLVCTCFRSRPHVALVRLCRGDSGTLRSHSEVGECFG